MPMTPELYQALLAMDAYSRGYLPGLDIVAAGASATTIGNATVDLKSNDPSAGIPGAQAAGFFAQAYTLAGFNVVWQT